MAGTYRKIRDGLEVWVVEIDGATYGIRLTASLNASPADLADVHSIIESMRYEPQANARGFRLVFTLTNDEWDSG